MQPHYAKTRPKPKLRTEPQQQSERELLFAIKNLEDALSRKMVFLDGLLFATEVTPRLVAAIHEELRRNRGAFDAECFGAVLQNPEEDSSTADGSVYRRIRTLGKHNQASYYERKESGHSRSGQSQLSSPVHA